MEDSETAEGFKTNKAIAGDGVDDEHGEESRQEEPGAMSGDGARRSSRDGAWTARRHRHRHRHRGKHSKSSQEDVGADGADPPAASSSAGKEEDKMKLLREFIPYFETGDAAGDSMVRSILSTANAQEMAADGDGDEFGNTLLILACQYRCRGLVPLILAKGDGVIDINAVNSAGACALHFACYKYSICAETVVLLLARGASPEVVEKTYGCTPLHYAAGSGDVSLCKRLVEAGASASTADFYQYTAVDYAKQSGAVDCVAYLEDITAASGAPNAEGSQGNFSAGGTSRRALARGTGVEGSGVPAIPEEGFEYEVTGVPAEPSFESGQLQRQSSFLREFGGGGGEEGEAGGGEDGEGYWGKHIDPASSMAYYLNEKTGESIWEKDFVLQARALGKGAGDQESSPQLQQWMVQQTQKARLVAYLGRHDPLGLMQVDELLKRRLGDEDALFAELTKKYGLDEDPTVADLVKDARQGFRGRKSTTASHDITPQGPSPTSASTKAQTTSSEEPKIRELVNVLSTVVEGATLALRKRPPTAPCHGPGKRAGTRPMSRSPSTLKSLGNSSKNLSIPETTPEFEEQTQKRLDDARIAHEEVMEKERQAHRDRVAEGKGTIARLEHDLEEAAAEEERLQAEADEQERLAKDLRQKIEAKMASQSESVKALSEEAVALRSELKNLTEETKALAALAEKEQSGAAAAAEMSRRDAEAKVKQESDLVQACQASIAAAKSDAERARRDFEFRRRTEKQELQERLGEELARLQEGLAKAKAKAATDISRAQSDAAAATSKAESVRATWAEISAQEEKIRAELERNALMAERNILLQGLITSESERRKKLHNKMEDMKGKIRVYVRVRPFSEKEKSRGCTEAVEGRGKQTIAVQDPRVKEEKTFDFDQVWSGTEEQGNDQLSIFKDTGYLVTSAVDGYNVCIFAYGQTGSGKTFTMFGAGGVGGGVDASTGQCDGTAGVTSRAVIELFRVLKERESQYKYSVKVSMFELYRDGLRDLLAKKPSNKKLSIKLAEHSSTGLVVVEGGVEKDANNIVEMIETIQMGAEGRTVSSTHMNTDSSRSHLLCSILITSTNCRTGSSLRGKLTLVDLAGSERVGKSGATGFQLKEAQSINKSLSALGDVISALTTGIKHIPYRNHALTMMMSDSLGGNSKTLMFVCASPADYNASETINALQFAARCKSITNASGPGGGATAAVQVQALRRELQKLRGEGGGKEAAKVPTQLARPL